jgi:mono/diheme cytochrome c family protein
VITGCNDCHTPGYAENGGKVSVENWLVGNTLGYHGPWGTTYAPNLRHYFERLSEDQWVQAAKSLKTRPPMPWFSVNAIADEDLRAMYAFVRSLGSSGAAAAKALQPGEQPPEPTVDWPMATK